MKRVAVVDYGVSNLDSVARALEECGATPFVTSNPAELKNASLMVLPGVGAFADGMRNLRERGLDQALREQVLEQRVPLLGVCLGMHLLADRGSEGGESQGLGLIPGTVQKLQPDAPGTRIPHVGWNEVHPARPSPLMEGIEDGRDFYFVHSYHLACDDPADVLATTPYCGGIASAVQRGIVAGVQFHPEKSQKAGFALLRNFVKG
ncbi:MAG TPA: imidazole glycerol phosphate synthase subunit HisH [Longimicrobium sp.]